jgi:hypothetical protein
MSNGRAVKFPFISQFTVAQYEANGALETCNGLSVCENDDAPSYQNNLGINHFFGVRKLTHLVFSLCKCTVDLRPLRPFTRRLGSQGYYYEVDYDLGVTFGPELIFKLVRDGKVMGSVVAKYD